MTGKLKADKANNYAYNKILQPFANKLRKEMTKAEACLWKYALRTSQMKGYQFRRQRPVLRYVADFLCIEEYERCYRENRKGGGRDEDVQSLHFSTPCTPASGGQLPLHPHKQGTKEVVKLS